MVHSDRERFPASYFGGSWARLGIGLRTRQLERPPVFRDVSAAGSPRPGSSSTATNWRWRQTFAIRGPSPPGAIVRC